MALLKSLAQLESNGKPSTSNAWLATWKGETFTDVRAFQYYPDSVSDSRSVNLEEKYGIGSSHPIYQWIRGSSREISFDVVFTNEDSTLSSAAFDQKEGGSDLLNTLDQVGGFIKNPATAVATTILGSIYKDPKHNTDIKAAIAWLRSFTYPVYENFKVSAPPRCALWLDGSGITSYVKGVSTVDVIPCIMTQCNVEYESFFNNGKPRVVKVGLHFVECIQFGDNWRYVNGSRLSKAGEAYQGPTSPKAAVPGFGED